MAYQPYTHHIMGAEIQEQYLKGSFALDLRDFVSQEASFWPLSLPPFFLYICVFITIAKHTQNKEKIYTSYQQYGSTISLCVLMIFLILHMLAMQKHYSALYFDYYL